MRIGHRGLKLIVGMVGGFALVCASMNSTRVFAQSSKDDVGLAAQVNQAKAVSEKLTAAQRNDVKERFATAFNLLKADELQAAKIGFERALAIDPANALGHFYLAELLARLNDPAARVHYALTQALAAVQPSDPDKIELYSVVVAAYGTQEVFRRESKFIENLFSTQYGNRTTSVYLTNSQRSMNENPLATLTSIKQAILDVANKMDKNKDILFLYITSHGSKDKKISLTHSGLGLGDIDAKWLGEILKSTGIKHKVIVLSACYSGGFIEDLKDDKSIVITSAAADRTSFGCGDDSHFTYFAKAYFKEALASKVDFVAAFYKAKTLVNEWEKSEKQKYEEQWVRF